MQRTWPIWTAFTVLLCVVLLALAWISAVLLRLDRSERLAQYQEAETRREALKMQDVRLALWRMDSALSPEIAQESARPYFVYRAQWSLGTPYQNYFTNTISGGSNTITMSPLRSSPTQFVLAHFQFEPNGQLTSPQLPDSQPYLDQVADSIDRNRLLAMLQELSPRDPPNGLANSNIAENPDEYVIASTPASTPTPLVRQSKSGQKVSNEYAQREEMNRKQSALMLSNNVLAQNYYNANQDQMRQMQMPSQQQLETPQDPFQQGLWQQTIQQPQYQQQQGFHQQQTFQQQAAISPYQLPDSRIELYRTNGNPVTNEDRSALARLTELTDVRNSLMHPIWVNGQLLLVREVRIQEQSYLQGCLLDWSAIRRHLLDEVTDLLPDADLIPFTNGLIPSVEAPDEYRLATLPVRLVAHTVIPGMAGQGVITPLDTPNETASPIFASLIIAWSCILAAALAVAGLLSGIMTLVRRRSSFVTAVTHELRTPLTTFRMYTEMLADGMVTDPEQQRLYLGTLRNESDRLTHMVENVLAYARLNRQRSSKTLKPVRFGDILPSTVERLTDRAERDSMRLDISAIDDRTLDCRLHVSPTALEQVLMNLVDNACKYAQHADDRRIHIETQIGGHASGKPTLRITVHDHGPGIPTDRHRRLFSPFSKSAHQAANDEKPGIGLGLHLSRQLARDMNARLTLDTTPDNSSGNDAPGTRFVLELPVA